MTSVERKTYTYGDNTYVSRSPASSEAGYLLAMAATAVIAKALPSFSNPFMKQIAKEHGNNHLYHDAFFKSVELSGLDKKGLTIQHVPKGLYSDHSLSEIGRGFNACYIPDKKIIRLNKDLATISGFHELGHSCNHLNSKIGKLLQKCRKPGYIIAGLMGTISMLSRTKPKEADRNALDFIQDNCGKIAFCAMLPTVIEEAMASRKGIKLAKQAGLKKPLINNLNKFYGKALLSYAGYAIITGLSVFAAGKIMEIFTRPKKID